MKNECTMFCPDGMARSRIDILDLQYQDVYRMVFLAYPKLLA